ncbi:hypothetical protein ACWA5Z_06550 [Testudinibacter sp. P80/BLE/0925]
MSKMDRKSAEELAIKLTHSLLESCPKAVLKSLRAADHPSDIASFIKNLADELQENLTSGSVGYFG